MLKILGRIYGLFTGSIVGNIVGAMIFCFTGWLANNWAKNSLKSVVGIDRGKHGTEIPAVAA